MHFNEKGVLTSIPLEEAAIAALKMAEDETQPDSGLKCRWSSLNRAVLKNWRFKTLVGLAGASGSAKSYLLNMMRTDFTDFEPIVLAAKGLSSNLITQLTTLGEFRRDGDNLVRLPLNGNYKSKVLWLHFGYDMAAEVEMLRTAAIMIGSNYAHLLSSESTVKDKKVIFNKMSKEELYVLKMVLKAYIKSRPNIIMFREPGSLQDMKIVIDRYANRYPDYKLGISIDHMLLIKRENIRSDLELINEASKVLKDIRDIYSALVIPLAQMNSEIEDDRRRLNPNLHYPMKSDIYMGGQFFQSVDFMFMAFMPESIHLLKYGLKGLPTAQLLHFSMIKSRHGKLGHAWLLNRLEHGQIYETSVPKIILPNEKIVLMPKNTLVKVLQNPQNIVI